MEKIEDEDGGGTNRFMEGNGNSEPEDAEAGE